jgi:hypothetical protein
MLVPLFVVILGKKLEMPFAVEILRAEQTDPRVEEQVKLLHTPVENLCKRKMPQLMYQHEEGQR